MASLFDRPVFILAAPRSGSTLLFETLQQSLSLYSLGDEGHGLIERHSALRPGPDGVDSNRLDASHLTHALGNAITQDLQRDVINSKGQTLEGQSSVRILEKTPKNILRIPFLNALFPDALFIYLRRDAHDNVSSIMDGWQSGRFVTYSNIQTRYGPWSFLLPPNWQNQQLDSLADAAAWQWQSCHEHAIQDLSAIESNRWCSLNYADLIAQPEKTLKQLCEFIGVAFDSALQQRCNTALPHSRYTVEAPAANKWHKNAKALAKPLSGLQHTIGAVNHFVNDKGQALNATPDSPKTTQHSNAEKATISDDKVDTSGPGRNQACPCGSGKKFKRCHGAL